MKVKEKIKAAVEEMEARDLSRVYDCIRIIEKMRHNLQISKQTTPIDKIHDMTRCSRTSWGNAVIEDREDRI